MSHSDAEEVEYVESEDEDFNPEAAAKDEDVSSSDEEEAAVIKPARKTIQKRPAQIDDELDSGDEATIQQSRRKKRKKGEDVADESGGEGGLIKTRAQRKAEKDERQEQRRAYRGEVTVDVEDLWARLASVPVGRKQAEAPLIQEVQPDDPANVAATAINGHISNKAEPMEADYITIRQSYEFAGQTVSEEKQVHRDSAEAKLYLSRQGGKPPDMPTLKLGEDGIALRRPLKRASMFEPNPIGEVRNLPPNKQRLRTPSRADVLAQQKRQEEEAKMKGDKTQRLNTVQKSKLDWASHVDSEGLKDELAEYDRSKQGYMAKVDFLQNVQGRRDQEERAARLQKV